MTAPPINVDRKSLLAWTGVSVVLAAIIVAITLFSGGVGSNLLAGRYLLTGLACVAPYLLVFLLLAAQSRPGAVTLGLACGLGLGLSAALIILLVAGTVGRAVVVLTMWSMPIVAGFMMGLVQLAQWVSRMNPAALMMLIVLGFVQFQVAKLAKPDRSTTGSSSSAQWKTGRAIGFMVLGVVAFVAMSGVSHAQAASTSRSIKSEEQQRARALEAYHAMVRLQACAAIYSDSVSKGEYPATLAEMGPAGSKCLDSATAGGSSSGYVFQYHPTKDSSGRTVGWWALALRPNAARGDDGLVADNTGALYTRRAVEYHVPNSTKTDSAVVLEQPQYSELSKWVRGARCIRDAHAADSANKGYPAEPARTEFMCLSIGRNAIVMDDHLLTYEADRRDRNGRFRNFVLHATALHYGRDAVRSFLIDADGTVHVTASQRPATSSDPVYVGCELENGGPCRIAGIDSQ